MNPKPFDPEYMQRLVVACNAALKDMPPHGRFQRAAQRHSVKYLDVIGLDLVRRRGVPALWPAVVNGHIPLRAAASRISTQPPEQQEADIEFFLHAPRRSNGGLAKRPNAARVCPSAEVVERHLTQLEDIVSVLDQYPVNTAVLTPFTIAKLRALRARLQKIIDRWRRYDCNKLPPEGQGADDIREPPGVGTGDRGDG